LPGDPELSILKKVESSRGAVKLFLYGCEVCQ
jgi:hypothetical protein